MATIRASERAIFDTWIAAYEARDVEKLMSLFTADVQYHAPCQPVQGFESLRSWFEYDFSRKDGRPSWTYKIESSDASGDLAVVVSRWTGVTEFQGFSANIERLRSIDFLRNEDGVWKIFRTINDPEDCGGASRLARDTGKSKASLKPGRKDKKRAKKR